MSESTSQQIRMLQLEYEVILSHARTRAGSSDSLQDFMRAAKIQQELSKLTSGEASQRHTEEARRLLRIVSEQIKPAKAIDSTARNDVVQAQPDGAMVADQLRPDAPSQPAAQPEAPEAPDASQRQYSPEELGSFRPELARITTPPKESFASLQGTDQAASDIVAHIEAIQKRRRYPNLASQLDSSPTHILLYGPPGTGKTFFIRTLANYVLTQVEGGAFFSVAAADLVDKYAGVQGKRLDALFQYMQAFDFPVLCIDELDALLPDPNSDTSRAYQAEFVASFRQYLDGVKGKTNVLVVGATNFPWRCDKAVRSRFSTKVFLGPPSDEAKRSFLLKNLAPFLPADPASRDALIARAIAGLQHADYRHLQQLQRAAGVVCFNKTVESNPEDTQIDVFLPLSEAEMADLVQDLVIDYDPEYNQRLMDPTRW